MTLARIGLGRAIVALLVVAEIVRPTHLTPKKVSYRTLAAVSAGGTLDREALEDLPPIVTPALGNIDVAAIESGSKTRPLTIAATMRLDDDLLLVGWCANPETHAAASALVATIDGRRRIDVTASYHLTRPDVADYYHAPAMAPSGFAVRLSGSVLGPGTHTIRMSVVDTDERGLFVYPSPETIAVTAR